MKKTLFFVIYCLSFLIACDGIFVHVSGKEADLQGKWQMNNADTVYYNFQNSLFQYQIYLKKDQMYSVQGYYVLHGDKALELRLLRQYSSKSLNYLGWDTLPSPTGQDTIFKIFTIEKFTTKELILSSENEKVSFHKF